MTKKPESKYRLPKYDPDDPKQFPSRLRKCIEAKGYTTKTFAQAAGFTESAVYNYLTGDNGMKIEDLVKTANLLGTTVDYLVGREDMHLPDPELRAMSEYLGLSQESIEMLHTFKAGRVVEVQYETDEDFQANQERINEAIANADDEGKVVVRGARSHHTKEIRILPKTICASAKRARSSWPPEGRSSHLPRCAGTKQRTTAISRRTRSRR